MRRRWWFKLALTFTVVATVVGIGGVFARLSAEGLSAASGDPVTTKDVSAAETAGWPSASTTGVPDNIRLRTSGPLRITEDGTVVDGLDVQGCVTIAADDVVIRRSRVRCLNAGGAVVTVSEGSQHVRLSQVEVDGTGSSVAGVTGSEVSVTWTEVQGVATGILVGDHSTVEDSWVHDLTAIGDGPVRAVDVQGRADIRVRGNYLQTYRSDRKLTGNALTIGQETSRVEDVEAADNLFDGGDVSVQARAAGLKVRDNVFTRRYTTAALQVGVGVTTKGNRYLNGEAVVPLISTATIGVPMTPIRQSPSSSAAATRRSGGPTSGSGAGAGSGTGSGSGGAVPGSWPNASTTGPSTAVTLKASGGLTVSKAGTVLQNLDINGCVTIGADNVVIRNSRIRCAAGGGNVVKVQSGLSGVLLESVELDGKGNTDICVAHGGYTLRRAEVHNCVDGVRAGSNTVIEDSWVHHLVRTSGSHNDAVQTVTGSNIVVRDNRLDAYNPDTKDLMNAAYIFGPSLGPVRGVTLTGNYLNGGNYTVNGGAENVVIRNNTFGQDHRYGPMRVEGAFSNSGNRYLNGASIS